MTTHILYLTEGKIQSVGLADAAKLGDETASEFAARLAPSVVPEGTDWVYIDSADLPAGIPPEQWSVDWQNGDVTGAPAGTEAGVVAERERRCALGYNHDFGDGRGVHHIGMTEQDKRGWTEVKAWADSKIAQAQLDATLVILTDTGPATIVPLDWQRIVDSGTAARQPIWAASFALQAMTPIPADYTDDSYWE